MQTHDISQERAEQIQIYKTYAKSSREYFNSRDEKDPQVRLAVYRRYLANVDNMAQMRTAECEKLAAARGWAVSRRAFTLQELKEGIVRRSCPPEYEHPIIDHPDCFKLGLKTVAIVSHTYSKWEACTEFAQLHGLNAERLDFSWYYPGGTIAVLFTCRKNSDGGIDRAAPRARPAIEAVTDSAAGVQP
jgi:hypothetical protein